MLNMDKLLKKLGPTRNYQGNPADKIKIAAEYIAYNMEGNENDQKLIDEIIFVTKKNIAETVLHQANEKKFKICNSSLVSPSDKFDAKKANTDLSMFLLMPEASLKKVADKMVEEAKKNEIKIVGKVSEKEEEAIVLKNRKLADVKNKYSNLQDLLADKLETYPRFEKDNQQCMNDKYNFISNLYQEIPQDPIGDVLNGLKGGFFENVFGTTSQEYKNFSKIFKDRMEGRASRDDLEKAAKAYLRHKIPNYAKTGKITMEDVEKISSETGKNRAAVCYQTLLAIDKSKNYEQQLANAENVSRRNLEKNGLTDELVDSYSRGINQNPRGLFSEEKQAEFRNDLNAVIEGDNKDLSDSLISDESLYDEKDEIQSTN